MPDSLSFWKKPYFCPNKQSLAQFYVLKMKVLHGKMGWLLGFALLLVTACGESKPAHIMPEAEMVPIVKDLQIAYAGVDATIRNPANRPVKYQEMNSQILQKYKVDKDRFYESFNYYQERPALMDSIYQKVITQLNVDIVPLQNKPKKRENTGRLPEAQ